MILSACALFFFVATPEQDPASITKVDADLQLSVNQAIEKGIDALLAQQEIDGSWRNAQPGFPAGMTALALYAMVKSGLPVEHPAIRNGRAFLRLHPPQKVYSMACAILAETSFKKRADKGNLQRMVDRLVKLQMNEGYAYPSGAVDLSNTQYAALALHIAAEGGAKVPAKVWRRFASAGLKYRVEPKSKKAVTGSVSAVGFRYKPNEGKVTGSMTAAGISVLQIATLHSKGKDAEVIAAREQGVAWLAKHFLINANPCPDIGAEGTGSRHYYYLYGVERVAGLLGLNEFDGHRWYEEGARYLVDQQEGNGRWQNNQSQSCFALLFLSRATVGGFAATGSDLDAGPTRDRYSYGHDDPSRPVSMRGSGRSKISLWVSSMGDRVMEVDSWPGENGPRVAAVRYRLERKSSAQPLIQMIEMPMKNPGQPLANRRFAWNGSFDAPGVWRVLVEVDIVPLDGELEDSDTWVTYRSTTADIPFQICWIPRMEKYAAVQRNVIADIECQITASSELDANWAASRALDQLQATGWRSSDSDESPSIRVEFDGSTRANTLVLSHAHNISHPDTSRQARVKLLRYRLNGSKRWTEAEMDTNDWKKTEIDLGKAQKIGSFEIEVLEVAPGNGGKSAVGFNEIELQLRK